VAVPRLPADPHRRLVLDRVPDNDFVVRAAFDHARCGETAALEARLERGLPHDGWTAR
jgi:hypothetical protein